jgi:histidine triad (HIT) family protein
VSDCLFCKIANKEIPSQVVFEDDQVIVFKDIEPVAPIHILLIPKIHVSNIADSKLVENGLATHMVTVIQKVADQLQLKENGFRVVINCGRDAGEAVHHLHYHIIAGRSLGWPPG